MNAVNAKIAMTDNSRTASMVVGRNEKTDMRDPYESGSIMPGTGECTWGWALKMRV